MPTISPPISAQFLHKFLPEFRQRLRQEFGPEFGQEWLAKFVPAAGGRVGTDPLSEFWGVSESAKKWLRNNEIPAKV